MAVLQGERVPEGSKIVLRVEQEQVTGAAEGDLGTRELLEALELGERAQRDS